MSRKCLEMILASLKEASVSQSGGTVRRGAVHIGSRVGGLHSQARR